MDAIDILGGLLGGKSRGGGGGSAAGSILKDIFGRGAASSSSRSGGSSPTHQPTDIEREAKELEDLLSVARSRQDQRGPSSSRMSEVPRMPDPPRMPTTPRAPTPPRAPSTPSMPNLNRRPAPLPRDNNRQNEQALILIKAMVNAAKSDGEISQEEQQAILDQLGNPSREAIEFLRQEFAEPLDVREFTWSVPLGMEQQVYMISLSAINLDVQEEANYLRDLAHGLRLAPDICNKIHQQLGAATIFTEF